jgi:hypothetical protein
MAPPFDIFHPETSGSVLWLESTATLADARARVQQIAVRSPGEYLLLNQKREIKSLSISMAWIEHRAADRKSAKQGDTP